jgi:hypothetical protein
VSELRKITCDHCGQDLTTTGNCVDYRIVLKSESIPSRGGVVTLMHLEPDIAEPKHFCGLECLKNWIIR